MISAIS